MAFNYYCTLANEFADHEIAVAEILLDLPRLFADSEQCSWLPSSWGAKKRRSMDANLVARPAVQSPSPSPIFSRPAGSAVTRTAAAAETGGPTTDKTEAANSPSTPLSFSPSSESDEIVKRPKRKISIKKRREALLKNISEVKESNELLRGEIQKVAEHCEELKARNALWKSRRLELRMGVVKREEHLNLQLDLGPGLGGPVKSPPENQAPPPPHPHPPLRMPGITVYHQPFVMDKHGSNQEIGGNYPNPIRRRVSLFQSTTTSGLGMVNDNNNVDPHGVLDLKLAVGEPMWIDSKQLMGGKSFNKALAAQARQRRMIICKNKNSNGSSKPRISIR